MEARLRWDTAQYRLRAFVRKRFFSKDEAQQFWETNFLPSLPTDYSRVIQRRGKPADGDFGLRVNWGKNLPDPNVAVEQMTAWLKSCGVEEVVYQPTLFSTPPELFGTQASLFDTDVPITRALPIRSRIRLTPEQNQRWAQIKGIV